jgi:hypothetical protein
VSNTHEFCAFHKLAEIGDRIIFQASKEDVAEASCLLALNIAHHQIKFGAHSQQDLGDMFRA